MRDKKYAYRIFVGNPEGAATMQHLAVVGGGMVILEWFIKNLRRCELDPSG
jgi:hypothetical protein